MDNENNGCGCVLSVIGVFVIIGIIGAIDWTSVQNGIMNILSSILGIVIFIGKIFLGIAAVVWVFKVLSESTSGITSAVAQKRKDDKKKQEDTFDFLDKELKNHIDKKDEKVTPTPSSLVSTGSKNPIGKDRLLDPLSLLEDPIKVTVKETTTTTTEVIIERDKSSS